MVSQGPPLTPEVMYTATPFSGSAIAATSATVRPWQPPSVCQDGLGNTVEQPLESFGQTDSVQPRALSARTRLVPPTAVTCSEAAGKLTPKPPSPAAAVMAMPG